MGAAAVLSLSGSALLFKVRAMLPLLVFKLFSDGSARGMKSDEGSFCRGFLCFFLAIFCVTKWKTVKAECEIRSQGGCNMLYERLHRRVLA